MIALHPNILTKNGKKEFAVLPFEEFSKLQKELLDYEDLKELHKAKSEEAGLGGISLSEAKEEWGI